MSGRGDARASARGRATKVCPRCGETLYADMDTCYGCLYDFSHERRPVPGLPQLPDSSLVRDDGWDDGLPPAEFEWNEDDTLDMAECAKVLGAAQDVPALWIRTSTLDVCVPIPASGVVIGRDPSSDIVFHSRAVSRRHLRIVPLPGGVIAENLGATNPALFHGRDIEDSVEVATGETVSLCGSLITVIGGAS